MAQDTANGGGEFVSHVMELEPDWIDYNGHLNMAFYNVLFDRGCDGAFEEIGLGPDYRERQNMSFFTAEAHVRYLRELRMGDRVRVRMRFLDHDEKRVHGWAELWHEDGWCSATSETMSLHVDMAGPKVAPFPAEVKARLDDVAARQAGLPRPEGAGRAIEIRRKKA